MTAQLTVPANVTAGQYGEPIALVLPLTTLAKLFNLVIGVQEIDDVDDDDDDDDDDRNENNPYDFSVNFESPDGKPSMVSVVKELWLT